MGIKTRRYRKSRRTHRVRRTRKNKKTRRYKKQMGGALEIKNETDLKNSWDNNLYGMWEAADGMGTWKRVFRNDFNSYDALKKDLEYMLTQLKNGQQEAFIRADVWQQ
jgi:hypothetical protein